VAEVLRGIKAKVLVVAITSDILFPPSDHEVMVRNIPNVEYHIIDSDFGHDGFLVEHEQLNTIITNFMQRE
jgi:homoserine O-acetyltransferase